MGVIEVVIASGGILVVGALLGLGLGWGFVAGVRAAGGIPHRIQWNGELKSVMRHYSSDGEKITVERVH